MLGWHYSDRYWNGSIDNVRIYDYARTPAQIAWDYNRGAPIGHWKFDECQGTTAHDASGNDNHGTINIGGSGSQTSAGTCTSGNSAHAWNNGREGRINSAMSFDGVDDLVNINTTKIAIGNDMTISSWIKTTNASQRPILSNRYTGGGRLYYGISSGKGFIYYNSASPPNLTTIANINDNTWQHFVFVRSGTTSTLYVNGVLDNSTTQTGYVSHNSDITIGFDTPNNQYYPGLIDDVRIYNYALTPLQIKTLYNDGAAIKFGN